MYVFDERDFKISSLQSVCNVSMSVIHKAQLRRHYEKKLANQDFFGLIEKSSRLVEQFAQLTQSCLPHLHGRFIVSYYPFDSEPQLNIERETRDELYQVAYVRIVDWKEGIMEARLARRDTPEQWEEYFLKNGTRIFQPFAQQPFCPSSEIAAILVPGLAFTKGGQRLGRGAGFYDRFLLLHPGALRIGVTFEGQIAEALPADSWDQNVDVVLTDFTRHETAKYAEFKKTGKIGLRSE